jgi:hypothetical protein
LIRDKHIESGILVCYSNQSLFEGDYFGKKSCFWHLRSLPDTHLSSTFPLYTAAMKMVKIWKVDIDEGRYKGVMTKEVALKTSQGDWGRRL